MRENKNNENKLTPQKNTANLELSDFDVCELYIKCVQVFADTASRLEMDRSVPLNLGKELWKETLGTLEEYRKSNRKTSNDNN